MLRGIDFVKHHKMNAKHTTKQPDVFYEQLQQHRDAIDGIDQQLLALLHQRSEIVHQVGVLKSEHRLSGSYIRAGREAIMLRDLLHQSKGPFPKRSIAAIWRILIGSSTALESPLHAITLPDDAVAMQEASHYFGPEVAVTSQEQNIWQDIMQKDAHALFIVPYHMEAQWWEWMAHSPLRVFACLPFTAEPTHLALGQLTPEATGDDLSLFYDPTTQCLITMEGFYDTEQNMLDPKGDALYIGAYAKPYIL